MSDTELIHYGVKGMRWGVRRYQNKDGSLTPAGKKRYDRMTDDQLQKTLYKRVKKTRSAQSDWSNQWNVRNTIGAHSKAAQEKYDRERRAYENSDSYKEAIRQSKKLDRRFDRGEIDPDTYDAEYEKIRRSIYRADLDSSVRYGHEGRKYVKAYLDKYGRDLNIGYLKDLGYDDSTARELVDRVLRANKKMLNGM